MCIVPLTHLLIVQLIGLALPEFLCKEQLSETMLWQLGPARDRFFFEPLKINLAG